MNRLNIKLCFWNIGGLKSKTPNKLSDPIFLQHIYKHDIILLAETHVGYGEAVNIPGYHYFPICRDQSKNGRYFGGLAILYKNELKPGIKLLPIMNSNFHWFILKNDFFNLEKDIYTCLVYYPPVQSATLHNQDCSILDLIEKDIIKHQDHGNIMLCGDFNARVGCENDFITKDNNNFNDKSII